MTRLLTIRHAEEDTILTLAGLATFNDSIEVRNTIDLSVLVQDRFGNDIPNDSLRFYVLTGTGGFNDTTRTTKDSIVQTDADGIGRIRLFTSTVPVTNTIIAKLFTTNDDSVTFFIKSLPRTVKSLSMIVDTVWTAGITENVQVTAYDEFGNITTNAANNIQLSSIASSSVQFVTGSTLPLTSGVVNFTTKDTIARAFMQLKANVSGVNGGQTEVTSQDLRVVHNKAKRFADSLLTVNSVTIGNSRLLTATVIDSFGNPVKDTTVIFAVISGSGGGVITSANPVTTDSLGKARVTYKTGNLVGTNLITAQGLSTSTIPGSPATAFFVINTDSVNANANYVAGSLQPRVVSENQITSFSVKFVNTGSFPITLEIDSTYILYNDGVTTYQAYLDTNISKTIGVGTSQLTFKADTINIATGKYPGTGHLAQINLYGS
ncbi:Ig-like domain-containing protein, partial [Candidatus Methanoperedens nitratireducens]|uniref:Ig-like domain-containing protein n=1 Tax=Candidatus Methanoperedens nitratireducens TaxID=1392998 RepID=UPI001C543972